VQTWVCFDEEKARLFTALKRAIRNI
jgi:hypothetical protein